MTLETPPGEQQAHDSEAPVDGRTARGQRTRASVVDALLALQEEGDLAPTAQRVAARAGVALRTVFGHFSDMETLWAEAGKRELQKLGTIAERPDRSLPLEQRIEAFCASRARVLEALLPVARAARLREPTSPQLQRNRELFIAAGDAEVRDVFAPELAELDAAARARLMDALYVASSGPSWDVLRTDRGLSPQEAAGVMHRLVTAVLS